MRFLLLILLLTFLNLSFAGQIATMQIDYKLTGEITNLNPYSIFVAIPDDITYTEKTLPTSGDVTKVSVETINESELITFGTSILNGKIGYWIPPYTTVKITIYGVQPEIYALNVDDSQKGYDIVGPAVVNSIKVINLKENFPLSKRKGIKISNFKLYVWGSIIKDDDAGVLSIVLPTPLILDNYNRFYKIVGKNDPDVWISSYNKWFKEHVKKTDDVNLDMDDPLIPRMDYDVGVDIEVLDVPAIAFTTSSTQPIEFSYVMYGD
ncbi:hypothetical protein [Methanotorris igneus]|uniref:Uncharacterized protein n=1 Tax=Methanotorris igneus (strain DSM 5666 / JCM 11834 / Kol 5) TaxID=880724 RepID=F6BDF4_METIK|nr:hypothetical protein [Methanotorris igneus]AEF96515.1 hypothetical protein Metig_0972 [Methanotorris igneus Kol 5]